MSRARNLRRSVAGRLGVAALAVVAAALSAGCSEKTEDSLRSSATQLTSDASGAANLGGARATAETFRGLVKTKLNGRPARTIVVLQETQGQLPSSNVAITGIADADGDGLDDDGYVQFSLDNRMACVQLPATGDNTEVMNDACPAS